MERAALHAALEELLQAAFETLIDSPDTRGF
jgi:hypothetical protein